MIWLKAQYSLQNCLLASFLSIVYVCVCLNLSVCTFFGTDSTLQILSSYISMWHLHMDYYDTVNHVFKMVIIFVVWLFMPIADEAFVREASNALQKYLNVTCIRFIKVLWSILLIWEPYLYFWHWCVSNPHSSYESI